MAEPRTDETVAAMVESLVGCKWSLRLLAAIAAGENRPSEMLRGCPGLSAKVMNERLAKMGRFGIVERRVRGERPPLEVRYELTPFGHGFLGIVDAIRRLQASLDCGELGGGRASAPREG